MRAILKWVGGKQRVMGHLKKAFGDVDCLVEPFAGSGSVFMNTHYPKYRLSDSNPDLINTLEVASRAPDDLIEACQELWDAGCTRDNYSAIRAKFNNRENITVEDAIDRAAWFIFLNRNGYNGLCRYNQTGGYNVPFGKHPTLPMLPKEEIQTFFKRTQESEVEITCCGFEQSIAEAPKGSLIYADPPYVPSTKTASFSQYNKDPFNQHQHRLLAKHLKEAHQRGCRVVLSNSDTPLTRDIYHGFRWVPIDVGRYLGADPERRGKVVELIGLLE